MSDALHTWGRFEDKTYILPVRIYYEDTDASGLVYHANYLRYFERGRSDMLRDLGLIHRELLTDRGLAWAVHRINMEFKRPGRLDDLLEVHTQLIRLTGARTVAHQTLRDGKELLVTAQVEIVCLSTDGRPQRLPSDIISSLEPYLTDPPN